MPKLSVDSKLKERGDQAAKVVAEDLTENLVDLGSRRLRANARAKLGFDHGERGLAMRPLVVVLEELFAVIAIFLVSVGDAEVQQPGASCSARSSNGGLLGVDFVVSRARVGEGTHGR
jgi:hypothetical protein